MPLPPFMADAAGLDADKAAAMSLDIWLPQLATPPVGAPVGAMYWDTVLKAVRRYDGAAWQTLFAAGVYTPMRSGLYYSSTAGSVAAAAMVVGTAYASPLMLNRVVTLTSIGVQVTTLSATGLVRLGIYDDDGSAYPGALRLDAGTVAASTTGHKEKAISHACGPGLIWLVAVAQTAAPSVNFLTGINMFVGFPSSNTITQSGYTMTGVTGALPAWSATVAVANVARVLVKAA